MNKVIVILGMHRSGTSFVTSWLSKCQLHIGEHLLKPGFNNVKGFFEDVMIMNFQDKILKRNRITNIFKVKVNQKIELKEEDYIKAIEIIDYKNSRYLQWGWKDPRTALLMENLWCQLLPDAKIIVVYRPYWQVVDSICRAEKKIQLNRRNKLLGLFNLLISYSKISIDNEIDNYLESWIRYNQNILSFLATKKKDDFCIINVDNILSDPSKVYNVLTQNLSLSLTFEHPNKIFDEELFQIVSKDKYAFSKDLVLKAENILKQLDVLSMRGGL